MARLNTRLSATPQQMRSSTVDSLYRDPSVAPRHERSARTSTYSVISPSHSITSDKENERPETRQNTPQPTKTRGLRGASARMPTPDSGPTPGGHSNKRRRTGKYNMTEPGILEDEPVEDEDEDGDGGQHDHEGERVHAQAESEDEGHLRFYNPNQDPNQRRRLRARMREHQRTVDGEFGREFASFASNTDRLRKP